MAVSGIGLLADRRLSDAMIPLAAALDYPRGLRSQQARDDRDLQQGQPGEGAPDRPRATRARRADHRWREEQSMMPARAIFRPCVQSQLARLEEASRKLV
jgi:hypothetical protein